MLERKVYCSKVRLTFAPVQAHSKCHVNFPSPLVELFLRLQRMEGFFPRPKKGVLKSDKAAMLRPTLTDRLSSIRTYAAEFQPVGPVCREGGIIFQQQAELKLTRASGESYHKATNAPDKQTPTKHIPLINLCTQMVG